MKNKVDSSPLCIQNPFEQSLNISKNVNKSQLERFVHLVQESSWTLQEQAGQSSESGKETWGLASILLTAGSEGASGSKKRLASDRISSLLDSLRSNNNRGTTTEKPKAKH